MDFTCYCTQDPVSSLRRCPVSVNTEGNCRPDRVVCTASLSSSLGAHSGLVLQLCAAAPPAVGHHSFAHGGQGEQSAPCVVVQMCSAVTASDEPAVEKQRLLSGVSQVLQSSPDPGIGPGHLAVSPTLRS